MSRSFFNSASTEISHRGRLICVVCVESRQASWPRTRNHCSDADAPRMPSPPWHSTHADDVGAVVGDVGSYSCKMGFAGEDFPKAYFTSVSAMCCNAAVWTMIHRIHIHIRRRLRYCGSRRELKSNDNHKASQPCALALYTIVCGLTAKGCACRVELTPPLFLFQTCLSRTDRLPSLRSV